MKDRMAKIMRKHRRIAGCLALGIFALTILTGSTWHSPDGKDVHNGHVEYQMEDIHNSQDGANGYYGMNVQEVHNGPPEQTNVDLTVNPFVGTAPEATAQASAAVSNGGNYRNLPAIPMVSPASQPRPVLPLPSIPRSTPQNQPAVASAPIKAAEPAPVENKEARIAFLGGGDIMFAHGMEKDK